MCQPRIPFDAAILSRASINVKMIFYFKTLFDFLAPRTPTC